MALYGNDRLIAGKSLNYFNPGFCGRKFRFCRVKIDYFPEFLKKIIQELEESANRHGYWNIVQLGYSINE
ncbi:MAG: hypothetical protein K8T10_10325 [Candidatus Eremiobacteraeota bacterium]|nr:hypothetical protein [Candidatus Eremiobacteraeota bacterium]